MGSKVKVFVILLIFIFVFFIYSCDDTDFEFYQRGKNKFFVEKRVNKKFILRFLKNYEKKVNEFFKVNGFLDNPDIKNHKLYIFVFKNSFKELKSKDKVIVENTKELQKKYDVFFGMLEDNRRTEDKLVGAFYVPHINSIFLKTSQSIPLTMDLIVELNHYFIFLNTPEKIKNYNLKAVYGFNIPPEKIDIENANYLYLIDDSITNFISFYNYLTGDYIIRKSNIPQFKKFMSQHLEKNGFKKDNNLKWVLKFSNYGGGEALFLYEYSFILYILDTYGYDKYKQMIRFLYNEKYNTINDVFINVFSIPFEQFLKKWEKYKEY